MSHKRRRVFRRNVRSSSSPRFSFAAVAHEQTRRNGHVARPAFSWTRPVKHAWHTRVSDSISTGGSPGARQSWPGREVSRARARRVLKYRRPRWTWRPVRARNDPDLYFPRSDPRRADDESRDYNAVPGRRRFSRCPPGNQCAACTSRPSTAAAVVFWTRALISLIIIWRRIARSISLRRCCLRGGYGIFFFNNYKTIRQLHSRYIFNVILLLNFRATKRKKLGIHSRHTQMYQNVLKTTSDSSKSIYFTTAIFVFCNPVYTSFH